MNLGLQTWCFLVPLGIQSQSALSGSGTEQEIFRKTLRESEDIVMLLKNIFMLF